MPHAPETPLERELLAAAASLERISFNESAGLMRRAAEEIGRQRALLARPELAPSRQLPQGSEAEAREWASRLGQLGGRKGGAQRARNLSPQRRSEIATKAAEARWSKPPVPAREPMPRVVTLPASSSGRTEEIHLAKDWEPLRPNRVDVLNPGPPKPNQGPF